MRDGYFHCLKNALAVWDLVETPLKHGWIKHLPETILMRVYDPYTKKSDDCAQQLFSTRISSAEIQIFREYFLGLV